MLTPILPLHIDSTMLNVLRNCPRKFYDEFVLGCRPEGLSIDLHAGGCIAAAIEETYKQVYLHNRSYQDAVDIAHARFLLEWGNFEIPHYKKTAKTMERCWEAIVGDGTPEGRGYFEEYPILSDEIKPFIAADGKPTLEYTFAIPLEPCCKPEELKDWNWQPNNMPFPEHPDGGPFLYCGRFDMLGQKNGRPLPKDEKTSGRSAGLEWPRLWQLRGQFIGYVWACQQCGIPATECAVRGIHILKESIKHSEHIQPYPQELIERWYDQLRRDLWRIRQMWDSQHWDYNFGEACTTYGTCFFTDACTSHQPEVWLQDMEIRRWNPLMKNPTQVADPSKAHAIS